MPANSWYYERGEKVWFPHKKISSQVSANPNIFNIMAGFGRYDHVTKNLIVFGHKSSREGT